MENIPIYIWNFGKIVILLLTNLARITNITKKKHGKIRRFRN